MCCENAAKMILPLVTRTAPISEPICWNFGSLKLSRGPLGRCSAPLQGADILIPISQPLTLHHANLQRIIRPSLDLLYLPSQAKGLRTSSLHGWRVELDAERLCQLAAELADHRLSPARFRRRLLTVQALQPRQSPQLELVEALMQLLHLSSCEPLHREQQLERLGLDRAIQRLVALLLCGDLIQSAMRRPEPQRGSKNQIFDQLLEWVDANLHRPLQLNELVEQSGYSQRSLRNFFQERFGCGPIHWIRTRRLQGARQRLLSPRPGDTVTCIAASFGYPHLSQFSRDFQKAYHLRPSDLLREGLRGLGSG
jgi:AraC-like DNA-binding protein